MKKVLKKFFKAVGIFCLGCLAVAGCWSAPLLLLVVALISVPLLIGVIIGSKD